MVLVTNDGREWYRDLAVGDVDTSLDAVAIGVGSGSEDSHSSSLSDEIYRDQFSGEHVEYTHLVFSRTRVLIQVTGGDEIPGGSEITEIGLLSGDTDSGETILVWVNEFPAVEVPDDETTSFGIEYNYVREQ